MTAKRTQNGIPSLLTTPNKPELYPALKENNKTVADYMVSNAVLQRISEKKVRYVLPQIMQHIEQRLKSELFFMAYATINFKAAYTIYTKVFLDFIYSTLFKPAMEYFLYEKAAKQSRTMLVKQKIDK